MEAEALLQAVSTIGFPIAVCCYMLFANDRLRGVIEENTLAITELKMLVKELRNDMKGVDYGSK